MPPTMGSEVHGFACAVSGTGRALPRCQARSAVRNMHQLAILRNFSRPLAVMRRPMRVLVNCGLCLACLQIAACNFPADPDRTLRSIENDELVVAVLASTESATQVDHSRADREPLGALAARLNARLVLLDGESHDAFSQLDAGTVHAVIGGIPFDTPWASHVALSNPTGKVRIGAQMKDRVIAVKQGENGFLLALNQAIRSTRKGGRDE